jgi:uncharacterized protein YhfF
MDEPKPHWREDVVREELSRQGFESSGPLPEVGWFGDSSDLASELGELVREGRKTATAGLLWAWEAEHGGPPLVGHQEVVIDWAGIPLAVIELTEVRVIRFRDVDASFARDEGEGDGSLAHWREAHRAFLGRECRRLGRPYTDDVPVVCMRFRLLHAAPNSAV